MDVASRAPPASAKEEQTVTVNLTCADSRKRGRRMDVHMKSAIFRGLTMLALLALLVAVVVATANAGALNRLSAEFQNEALGSVGGEVSTNVGPTAGGTVVYDKTLSIPFHVAYITFSAQGDTHKGTALLMSASVTNKDGVTTICQPMANAGGAAEFGAPWMTLMKLPTNPTIDAGGTLNNCRETIPGSPPTTISGDGGGGSADCHDNSFMFSCCVLPKPAAGGDTTQRVKIKMASSLGTGGKDLHLVFYEDSTIYIDGQAKLGEDSEESKTFSNFCRGVGTGPHSDPVIGESGD